VVAGIAADQAMAIETPNISWPADRGGRITGTDGDFVLGIGFGRTVRRTSSSGAPAS
jgi:hypothetical protein